MSSQYISIALNYISDPIAAMRSGVLIYIRIYKFIYYADIGNGTGWERDAGLEICLHLFDADICYSYRYCFVDIEVTVNVFVGVIFFLTFGYFQKHVHKFLDLYRETINN